MKSLQIKFVMNLKQGKLMINVMSHRYQEKPQHFFVPLERLKDTCRVGVMECDIDAMLMLKTIEEGGR